MCVCCLLCVLAFLWQFCVVLIDYPVLRDSMTDVSSFFVVSDGLVVDSLAVLSFYVILFGCHVFVEP